ncbi:MAG: hypothetical protein R3F34_19800 [Planctomycetota bacterium]
MSGCGHGLRPDDLEELLAPRRRRRRTTPSTGRLVVTTHPVRVAFAVATVLGLVAMAAV